MAAQETGFRLPGALPLRPPFTLPAGGGAVFDPVEVGLGADVKGAASGGGRGHQAVVQVVGRDDFAGVAGLDHGASAFLIEEIKPSVGLDGRGLVTAAD